MPQSSAPNSALVRWLVFVVGAAALCFSNGIHANILAAWLAPVLLLRFVMTTGPLAGFALTSIASAIAAFVMFRGAIPMPDIEYAITSAISGVVGGLPYVIHRLIAPRLVGLLASLVFPTAGLTLLYALSLGSPFGTWGNDAYVQLAFLPLVQLASLTGIWGIAFVVMWFASAVQPLFDTRAPRAIAPIAGFGACFVAVLGCGAWWIYSSPRAETVRVAALSNPAEFSDRFFEGCGSRDDYACRAANSASRLDALFALSETAVREGASLIVWYEGAAQFDAQFEQAFIERARSFAESQGVYLITGAVSVPNEPDALMHNKAIVFTPDGDVALEYLKSVPVPGEPIVAGDGRVTTLATPFGRIAVVICFDADFPAFARQAALQRADLLVIPSNDWRAITPLHGEMSVMRGIEGGFGVLRAASNGLSVAADANGVRLASNDSFTSPGEIMYAEMPMTRRPTLYGQIGDYFAHGCVVAFLLLLIAGAWSALVRR
jgi:apolipoprotein N-acyltransferase